MNVARGVSWTGEGASFRLTLHAIEGGETGPVQPGIPIGVTINIAVANADGAPAPAPVTVTLSPHDATMLGAQLRLLVMGRIGS